MGIVFGATLPGIPTFRMRGRQKADALLGKRIEEVSLLSEAS